MNEIAKVKKEVKLKRWTEMKAGLTFRNDVIKTQ